MTTTRRNPSLLRCLPFLLSAVAVTLTGCAHSTPPSDTEPANEATAMTATSSNLAADNPTLTAEEIGKRFLKLIEGLESRGDLSLERVREVTGISLTQEPGALGAGYWSHDLGSGWRFALTYYPKSPSLLEGIGLSFEPHEDGFSNMAPICTLDFDHYHDALVAMGFRAVPIHGEIRELRSWRYYKGDITLSIIPQNVVSGESDRLCVKSIGTLN